VKGDQRQSHCFRLHVQRRFSAFAIPLNRPFSTTAVENDMKKEKNQPVLSPLPHFTSFSIHHLSDFNASVADMRATAAAQCCTFIRVASPFMSL